MKTTSIPVPQSVKRPMSAYPRQLCMTFETPVLLAATPEQRAMATQVLAAVLMQAAGLNDQETDDV